MKASRLFWGVFFVVLGLLLLADRFGLFVLDLYDLWKLWPLILVLLGFGLLYRASSYRWVPLALAGVLGALILASLVNLSWADREWRWEKSGPAHVENFTAAMRPGLERASFHFDGGAGAFVVRDGEGQLLSARTETDFGEYGFMHDSLGNHDELSLSLEGSRRGWRFGRTKNHVEVTMHPDPVWSLDFEMGAASVDLDLSKLAVERLSVDCGASKSVIRLGERIEAAQVEINAGASTIRIEVPETAGCEVRIEAPLSSKRLPGFTKVDGGEYRTENFGSAGKTISILVHAGVSSVRVTRY